MLHEIKFDPAGVSKAVPGKDTTVFNYEGGEYKRTQGSVKHVNPASIETLVDSMSAYQAYAPARDWRMLLRHFTSFDKRYYPERWLVDSGNINFQKLCREVEKYLAFFAPRNCNVGEKPVSDKTEVTVGWANAALDEMSTLTRSVLTPQCQLRPVTTGPHAHLSLCPLHGRPVAQLSDSGPHVAACSRSNGCRTRA